MKTRLIVAFAVLLAACASTASDAGQVVRTTIADPSTTSATSSPVTTTGQSDGTTETTAPDATATSSPTTTQPQGPSSPVPCEAPPESAVYCQPFVLDQGATQVIWDRWFWGQGVFSKGTVEVITDGEVVASGPFFGADSIMQQGSDRSFLIYDDGGQVVATVTQQELSEAIARAIEEAGLEG